MKKVKKEVKSKGQVVDTIEVPYYETMLEATKAIGTDKALEMVNKAVSDGLTNAARAAKTRPVSQKAIMNQLMAEDPELKKRIEARVAKMMAEAQAQK